MTDIFIFGQHFDKLSVTISVTLVNQAVSLSLSKAVTG